MKVFAIVVTYNGSAWIDNCFGSLQSSNVSLNILAINNASTDDTVLKISTSFPSVQIIETGANLGFGKANNIGLKRALEENADYVFLLNQDAWVENDTLEKLIEVAEENPEYGIVSPFHLLPESEKLEWHFSTYIKPEKCADLYADIYSGSTKKIYETDFINAAAWLITKDCLRMVGGFDPLFSHYGEDEDYCSRVKFKKLKIGVTPLAKIFHDITIKSWEQIKFSFDRRMIFNLIELKNINLSYKYVLLNYTGKSMNNLMYLLWTRKWKEFSFMTKLFFNSFAFFSKVKRSRRDAKMDYAYLN